MNLLPSNKWGLKEVLLLLKKIYFEDICNSYFVATLRVYISHSLHAATFYVR